MCSNESGEEDLEWEEWDGRSPFLHHCLAGSIAGIAEHTLLYPVDTVKTHMQSYCANCPNAGKGSSMGKGTATQAVGKHGMLSTFRHLLYQSHAQPLPLHQLEQRVTRVPRVSEAVRAAADDLVAPLRVARLWRGVHSMVLGCAPAHALYFSMYEAVKAVSLATSNTPHLSPAGSAAAGAAATVCHDLIMTPLDTIKQRLQLGHYNGITDAAKSIVKYEGYVGLYRSFPITLLTNVPYGMVMVSTNESLKSYLDPDGHFDVQTCMIAGCGAGIVAAATTTPLDRIKTRLQTQRLGAIDSILQTAATKCDGVPYSPKCGKAQAEAMLAHREAAYTGLTDAFRTILKEEGVPGLFRGMTPRLLTHAPAVAISWTTYETAKKWLKANLE